MTRWGKTESERTCRRKHQYKTKSQAKTSARRFGGQSQRKLYVYECPECAGWHLTHIDPETYRRRKREEQIPG